jgi:prevent-host-death family protein
VLNIPLDKIIPVTYARDNLANLIKETNGDTIYVLTKGGRPKVALVDIVYLEKLVGHKLTTNNFSTPAANDSSSTKPAETKTPQEPEEIILAKDVITPEKKEVKEEPIKTTESKAPEAPKIPEIENKLKKEDDNPVIKDNASLNNDVATTSSISPVESASSNNTSKITNESNITDSDQIPFMNFSPQDQDKIPAPQIPSADEITKEENKPASANPVSAAPAAPANNIPPAPAITIASPSSGSIASAPNQASSSSTSPIPAVNKSADPSSALNNVAPSVPVDPAKPTEVKKPEGTVIPINKKNQPDSATAKTLSAAPITGHANVADMDIG